LESLLGFLSIATRGGGLFLVSAGRIPFAGNGDRQRKKPTFPKNEEHEEIRKTSMGYVIFLSALLYNPKSR
jgi:hypothetical protein